MKFSILTVAASVAAVVSAQGVLDQLPSCARTCVITAVQDSSCGLTDSECHCTTGRTSIQNRLDSCLPNSDCSQEDLGTITDGIEAYCKAAGVTVTDLPTAFTSGGSPASTGAPAATTGSADPEETGAAYANVAGLGAVALGLVAAVGL